MNNRFLDQLNEMSRAKEKSGCSVPQIVTFLQGRGLSMDELFLQGGWSHALIKMVPSEFITVDDLFQHIIDP